MDGIGWVALLSDLADEDRVTGTVTQPAHCTAWQARSWPASRPVVVTRWADGTIPAPSTPTPQAPDGVWIDETTAAHIVSLAGYAVAASKGYPEAAGIIRAAEAVVPVVESLLTDSYLDTWDFTRTSPGGSVEHGDQT